VNAAVCSQLSDHNHLYVVDTAVQTDVSLAYHLRRWWRHIDGAVTMLRHSRDPRRRYIYVTSPGGAALWYVLPLIALARLLSYRVVVHHHSFAYINRFSIAMRALVAAAGNPGRHVLLCPEMRDRFDLAYRPNQPSAVCSNAAWLGARSDCAPKSSDKRPLRIGHLGTLTPEKGIDELTQLTLALISQGINAELWLAGAPPNESDRARLQSALQALGPSHGRWLGILEGQAKATFFDDIDVFVLPSRYRHEAQPLVVFEALQASVPVISYAVGCVPGQLRSSGLLISPEARLEQEAIPFLRKLYHDAETQSAARRAARRAFEAARSEAVDQSLALIADIAAE
jgi:glycosyltransferase involved in cell wall biosynthesis